MGQTLGKLGSFSLTLEGIGLTVSIATFLVLGLAWSWNAKKRGGRKPAGGRWANAMGFALLPAVAVWKAFEDHAAPGRGIAVEAPFPALPFVTLEGIWRPCRLEMILAILMFFGLCLWLIIRKKELPGNGDLLLIVCCLWGCVRSVTESFRVTEAVFPGFVRTVSILMMLIPLCWWIIRRIRQQKTVLQTVLDGGGGLACGVILWLTSRGILSVGSHIGNLALITGCAIILCVITLLAGRDTRT